MAELKPCPFCGGEAKLRSYYNDHHVFCTKCYATTIKYSATKAKAIEAWNRRVENPCVHCDDFEPMWRMT